MELEFWNKVKAALGHQCSYFDWYSVAVLMSGKVQRMDGPDQISVAKESGVTIVYERGFPHDTVEFKVGSDSHKIEGGFHGMEFMDSMFNQPAVLPRIDLNSIACGHCGTFSTAIDHSCNSCGAPKAA